MLCLTQILLKNAYANITELFTEQQNFKLVQIQSICRRQNNSDQNFLLLPKCFQKLSFPEGFKVGIMWSWVKNKGENP